MSMVAGSISSVTTSSPAIAPSKRRASANVPVQAKPRGLALIFKRLE
eukprot:CAMPEP_0177474226 /NCGR_PEP_ID=MMETSP0369-20130122/22328_1 /TAXON_ID=447022 ORGANISM="Scrippsiella hangoei-like, Strain SHHI-4" /NCGR_SAMPLE_ID=MMETSP0369 /ASSEMBLY_ACC=CAM_ASM_000364 /LENGTH=46 /DNA_ID= /DNA_START= /DNA_END= /DNA_ORIENTATION=